MVVCNCNTPKTHILSLYRIPKPARSASQDVTIIAADAFDFNEAIIAVREIHGIFGLHLPDKTLIDLEQDVLEGDLGLTFGTRYFTPSTVSTASTSQPLSVTIDPFGHLAKAVGNRGKHLEDNQVLYYKYKPDRDGKK